MNLTLKHSAISAIVVRGKHASKSLAVYQVYQVNGYSVQLEIWWMSRDPVFFQKMLIIFFLCTKYKALSFPSLTLYCSLLVKNVEVRVYIILQ